MSDSAWSGWYWGFGLGVLRTNSNVAYQHWHAGNCVNLNFGSEWPGDGCEGNQDYSNNFASHRSGLSSSLKIGHNWMVSQFLVGVVGDISITKSPSQKVRQVLSTTWGDALSISAQQGNYLSVRTIVGKPYGDYLPYVTAGIAATEIKTSITQDQPGYDLRTFATSPYKFGYVIGAGFKHRVNDRWIIGAEYMHSDYAASNLDKGNVILAGGIRFPDTFSKTNISSDLMNLTTEYRF